jgi:hypothetical protein
VANDFTFLAIMIGFFVLAGLFVIACDHLIGSEEAAFEAMVDEPEPTPAVDEDVAA